MIAQDTCLYGLVSHHTVMHMHSVHTSYLTIKYEHKHIAHLHSSYWSGICMISATPLFSSYTIPIRTTAAL